MGIVGGFDLHRRQITFDYIDTDTGETSRGQIKPATRVEVRAWLTRLDSRDASFVLEGTTGWRFVVEELRRAGVEAHVAGPAETRAFSLLARMCAEPVLGEDPLHRVGELVC
jgi:transposase